jgi:hypothetical protein
MSKWRFENRGTAKLDGVTITTDDAAVFVSVNHVRTMRNGDYTVVHIPVSVLRRLLDGKGES